MAATAYRARSTLRETTGGDWSKMVSACRRLGWSVGSPAYSGSVASLRSRASKVSAAHASFRADPA